MARSLSHARLLFSLVPENLSIALNRRGYAAASGGASMIRGGGSGIGKSVPEKMAQSAEKSWIPDPVTGYYRPANQKNEIDVAELREMLLKQKIRSQ